MILYKSRHKLFLEDIKNCSSIQFFEPSLYFSKIKLLPWPKSQKLFSSLQLQNLKWPPKIQ
ncbi:hypothetical protein AWRI1631_112410 [Saccharomyces cerevisiae AWRI1631]|uniref:Uncharacterized protein n=1 Tax=Saccharomyces cerevisiae (strain AWRI1631) TaxID=545124 RepID=B5VMG6_YEAS6|nr:hypothetical protein AWRI1631_112410 [Saccharomyces cerevisiae AWRI1631]